MLLLPLPRGCDGVVVKKTPNMASRRRRYWFARKNSGTPLTGAQDEEHGKPNHDENLLEGPTINTIPWIEAKRRNFLQRD
jgi:hypothetical protein